MRLEPAVIALMFTVSPYIASTMYCLIPRPDQWFMNFVYCHEKYAMLMSLFVSDGKHLFALFERLRNFNKLLIKNNFQYMISLIIIIIVYFYVNLQTKPNVDIRRRQRGFLGTTRQLRSYKERPGNQLVHHFPRLSRHRDGQLSLVTHVKWLLGAELITIKGAHCHY